MTKKIFHVVLSLMLVFSLCTPISAFAAEATNEANTIETTMSDDTENAVVLASTSANGFTYPGTTTVNLTTSKTKVKYCGVAPSSGTVIIRLTKTNGSDQRSFTLVCDGGWYTIDRSSNPIPSGSYKISIIYANISNYTLFVNFS